MKIVFLDVSTGFAGHSGKLLKTTDGGNTWRVLDNSPTGVYSMCFHTESKGITFGMKEYSNGNCNVWTASVHITDDSGENWQGDNRLDGDVQRASYPNENVCFAIVNYSQVFRIENN